MPDDGDLEAAQQRVRQKAEEDLYRARQRYEEAKAREQQARDEGLTDYRAPWDNTPRNDEAEHRDPAVREAARDTRLAREELERAQQLLDNLPPAEDILSEIDDINPEWGGKEASKKYQTGGQPEPEKAPLPTRVGYSTGGLPPKTNVPYDEGDPGLYDDGWDPGPVRGGPLGMGGCLRAGGLVSTVAGAVLLLFSVPIFGGDVTPGGEPGTSLPLQSPTAQSPTAPSSAVASPPAQSPSGAGVTGTALGLTDFTRTGGTCTPETFTVGFALEANAGALTLHQLGQTEHTSTGTVDEDGDWETTGDGQSYRGRMYGSYIGAVHMDDAGCTYDVRGWLTSMLTEPAPYNSTPGYFEFGDLRTNRFGLGLLDLATGVRPHVVVASDGDLDVRTKLPITVVLLVDGSEVSRFVIEGNPADICRDATGCSLDAPFERMARWSEPNVRLLLTATGADGQLIAAHAPNGLPAGAVPGASPSVSPSVAPSASIAPTPAATVTPTTPPVATGGRTVNAPLAGLGALLLIAGLVMLGGPRLVGGPKGAPPRKPPSGGVTPDEAKKIGDILDNRPPPPTPTPTPSEVAGRYEGTPSGVTPDEAKKLGEILDNRPPPATPTPTPTPSEVAGRYEGTPSAVTPDEAKKIGDILDNRPAAPPTPPATPGPTGQPAGGVTPEEARKIGDILDNRPPPPTQPPAPGTPGTPPGGSPGGSPPPPEAPKGPGQPR